ncbi:MAG: hypothetical protein WCJ26_03610 [bacterium]
MKSIKFSDAELEFLQNHYELELMDAENYVGEIKNILKKLGAIEQEVAKEKPAVKSGKKAGRPKQEKKVAAEKVVAPEVKATKKPTPKKAAKKAPKAAKKAATKKVAAFAQAPAEPAK